MTLTPLLLLQVAVNTGSDALLSPYEATGMEHTRAIAVQATRVMAGSDALEGPSRLEQLRRMAEVDAAKRREEEEVQRGAMRSAIANAAQGEQQAEAKRAEGQWRGIGGRKQVEDEGRGGSTRPASLAGEE